MNKRTPRIILLSIIISLLPTVSYAIDKDAAALYNMVSGVFNNLLLPLGSVLAGIVILVGGIMYASSAGEQARVTKAKELIFGAITGLVLLITASLIIRTIVG